MAEQQVVEETKLGSHEATGIDLDVLKKQLENEYKVGEDYVRDWRAKKRTYLKLLLNQRKDEKKVGDTLTFSVHQTILASLYKDRLDAEWMWREEEDEDRAEALNAIWEFDYDEMGKAEHDYGKYWDACFFGLAIEDLSHFDRDSLTPIPDLWDPLTFWVDPKATSINGNRLKRGAARFIGRDIMRTKEEMEDLGFFNLDKLKENDGVTAEYQKTLQDRADARGATADPFTDLEYNRNYQLGQTYSIVNGKRYLIEYTRGNTIPVRIQAIKQGYWPLVLSRIYPDPHTFLTPGCPDFTEDKQRARAILRNWTLEAAKLDVLPETLVDVSKIVNKQQLREHKAGKYIEGKNIDQNTMIPIQKPSIHQYVDALMKELELNAQKAVATPELQQGIMFSQKRSATEIAEASTNVDTRYSLTAALFAIAESDFAYIWYDLYKENFKKGIDKKSIRVIGAFGPKAQKITADDFAFNVDPDVRIESRVVSLAKKREQRESLQAYGVILINTPGANLRYYAKKMGRLLFKKDEVDRLLPPTIDEMVAKEENEKLAENSLDGVEIDPTQDHKTHREIHSQAPDTPAKFAHLKAHDRAEMMQRYRPELFNPQALPQENPAFPSAEPAATLPEQVTNLRQ